MAGLKNPLSVNYISEVRILESIAFLDNLEFILKNNNHHIPSNNNNENDTVCLIPDSLHVPLNVSYPKQGGIRSGNRNKIIDELILPQTERNELFSPKKDQNKNNNNNIQNNKNAAELQLNQKNNDNYNENSSRNNDSNNYNNNSDNADKYDEHTRTMSSPITLTNFNSDQLKSVKSPQNRKYDNRNSYNNNNNNNNRNNGGGNGSGSAYKMDTRRLDANSIVSQF